MLVFNKRVSEATKEELEEEVERRKEEERLRGFQELRMTNQNYLDYIQDHIDEFRVSEIEVEDRVTTVIGFERL